MADDIDIVEDNIEGSLTIVTPMAMDSVLRPGFRCVVEAVQKTQSRTVVIDLRKSTFMDSSGVGCIVTVFKQANARGLALSIAGAHGQPLSLLRTLNVDKAINFV
jgi:anti-anti-sigma factor